ncbi:MAG: hypothetical protein WEB60_01085 [Terrimicrobiaceae bacterium]
MRSLCNIRVLWTFGFLVLVSAQLLHAYGHWEQISVGDHAACAHSHEPDPGADPFSPSDPAADHCHSPAILVAQVTVPRNSTVTVHPEVEPGIPEAPVMSIDYPPQLS